MIVESFDPHAAPEADYDAHYRLRAATTAADAPQFPPPPRAMMDALLREQPSWPGRYQFWVARSGEGELIGLSWLGELESPNEQLAAICVNVHPAHRDRGIGSALLAPPVRAAELAGRPRLLTPCVNEASPGPAWVRHRGFQQAYRHHVQLLELGTQPAPSAVAAGYRLETWTGSAPDELLESYAAARRAIDDAPHHQMSYRSPRWTGSKVRDHEATRREAGLAHLVVAAVHEATGAVAGHTIVNIREGVPTAQQDDTAVLAAHRGHGLGLAMKTAMLARLTAEYPQAERVHTANASDNEAMLRINRALGFETRAIHLNFEADTTSVSLP
ncbi:GNAT family N-acetyltransferase [Longispora albida]|uniref:GNAT family N-acetyltransferase n=1 Tax=Longispora albida TaxID=203523 RepID=UPI00037110CC|nr:GNAT family N-acetyltransferase [Longispora albida]